MIMFMLLVMLPNLVGLLKPHKVCNLISKTLLHTTSMTSPRVELLDGGTGEELFRRGVKDDRKIWSAIAVVDPQYHKILQDVHISFINAGSKYITCNNYGITPGVGFSSEEVANLTKSAAALAVGARKLSGKKDIKICGSLPPLLESYRPDKLMQFDEGVDYYKRIALSLEVVDVFLGETLSSSTEVLMVMKAVENMSKPLFVSCTLNSRGDLRSGEKVEEYIGMLLHKVQEEEYCNLKAILFNCAEPEAITAALERIHRNGNNILNRLDEYGIRIGAYANRLTPVAEDWSLNSSEAPQPFRSDITVETYLKHVEIWVERYNVQLIGGCCGIGPEYISRMLKYLVEKDYLVS